MWLESHADYEARNPDEEEYAQAVEQNRAAAWLQSHDTLDGYTPGREFPCTGSIRVVDQNMTHRTLACDACPWVSTVRVAAVKTAEEAW